jgi:uncharacterized membrane protein
MMTDTRQPTATVGGHPLHMLLVPIPIGCFVATLVTDIIYALTANMLWETMSVWLLTAGLIFAGLAVVAGLIDFVFSRRIRALKPAWPHLVGNAIAVSLSPVNAFVHSRDGYTSVVPTGLTLSAIVVLILAFTGWMGWKMVHRDGVGAAA